MVSWEKEIDGVEGRIYRQMQSRSRVLHRHVDTRYVTNFGDGNDLLAMTKCPS